MARRPTPTSDSRANGAPAPASTAATAPGFVDGQPTQAFYDAAESDEREDLDESPLANAAFVQTVRERHVALETGGSADVEVAESLAAEAFTDTDDLAAEIARIRQFRAPVGSYTQKLALPERRGYKRHWFNDVAGRIDMAKAGGWSHVLDGKGGNVARCVGTGRDSGAMYAFAMEIPEVFWLEDMAARNEDAQAKVDALKHSPFRAPQGVAKASDKGKFYDPSDHDAGPLQVIKSGG